MDAELLVAPYMGAWIEIPCIGSSTNLALVAPYMGAWIEIKSSSLSIIHGPGSLPTWERGLKLVVPILYFLLPYVAPYMGAWIEIGLYEETRGYLGVAPYMGAWIEIRLHLMQ